MSKDQLRQVTSLAQARKLMELANRGKIQGHDGMTGHEVVSEMFKRSPSFNTLPERVKRAK